MSINLTKTFKAGENETVEFKNSLAERDQILETVSAFANARGGTIYVGISPEGITTGVQLGKKSLEDLANEVKLRTDPKIFPSIETLSYSDKQIVRVCIEEHPAKPVWIGDKVFVRVGKTNQRVPSERIRQLIRQSQPFQWDQQFLADSKPSEIDSQALRHFVGVAEEERNASLDGRESAIKLLERLHLSENGRLTSSAVLLFGKNPQERYPQSCIQCGRFKGSDTAEFEDMKLIGGTIINQVTDALAFVRDHVRVAARFSGKPERTEDWEYPRGALREAIINAVCHRDYQDAGKIQVRIFDDRLEIWSPGTLPPGLTIEDLKANHRSLPRNVRVAECFYLLKFVEQWGTGTNRIYRLCKEAGLRAPVFAEKAGSFVVVFKRGLGKPLIEESVHPLTKTQLLIVRYLGKRKDKAASARQLADHLKISDVAVRKHLKGMRHLVRWNGRSTNDPVGKYVLVSGK